MADRNRNDTDYRNQDQGDQAYESGRQFEQYQDSSGGQQAGYTDQDGWSDNQMGEPARGADFYYEEVILVPRRSRRGDSARGYARNRDVRDRAYEDRDYGRGYRDRGYSDRRDYAGYGRESGYGPSTGRRYANFTSEDQGGRDFTSPTGRWSPRYGAAPTGSYGERDDGFRSPRYSDRPRERDWWDRTTDEVASWFGDEDASRRREMDHRGRGPSDYTRSDERIREDVSDNLTDDWAVDARNVRVKVEKGEVTLDGTVATRLQKRRAEDCAEDVSGVTHVQNNLRVKDRNDWNDRNTAPSASASAKTG